MIVESPLLYSLIINREYINNAWVSRYSPHF